MLRVRAGDHRSHELAKAQRGTCKPACTKNHGYAHEPLDAGENRGSSRARRAGCKRRHGPRPMRAARAARTYELRAAPEASLDRLLTEITTCRICRDAPVASAPLSHDPRPVLRAAKSARILIAGQAPGKRVHASGVPYADRSGDR